MPKVTEFRYTICPVGNSSFISANKNEFLQNAVEKLGVKATKLQTLPSSCWNAHFNYEDDALFREGGNIPPIWARSRGASPVLIGLTFVDQRSAILTRVDSPINRVAQLRGKRLGLPIDPEIIIDFYAATVHHGFKTALEANGVGLSEVEFVKTTDKREHDNQKPTSIGQSSIDALDAGEVDAVFASLTGVQRLLDTGKYKILYNLHANTDVVLPINNTYPNVLTVSKKLAEEAPEIVVEYVKQALLAAEWAKTHLAETVTLFTKQLYATAGEVVNSYIQPDFNQYLAPVLDEGGLAALEGQKRYLFDAGYIEKDFDLGTWADDSFLKTAHRELAAQAKKGA